MKQTFVPKFTYIIPFRYQQDRMIPFKRVIEWISGFANIEIIIVEQDKNSKLSNLSFKGQHIFVESDLPFNKAWAFNIALRRTNSPIMVFADGDFVMHPNDLIESMRALDSYDCVIPTSNIVKLNSNESHADLNSILQIKRPSPKISMTDGISIFKRKAIERIGGWNEDILGHGYVNKFQDMKIKKMLSVKELDFTGYHFSHRIENREENLSQRNQQIIDFYLNPSNDLQQHINNTVTKSGFLNKYQF